MQTIELETLIAAPAMRVFLLSLSVDLHKQSAAQTNEEAIAGVTSGFMGLGDEVTWRARHFGLMLAHTSRITQYSAPDCFVDSMVKGAFHSFEHMHRFDEEAGRTLMHDRLDFSSPLGLLGAVVDCFVLRQYLSRFLAGRNQLIRDVAEAQSWRDFIPPNLQAGCE